MQRIPGNSHQPSINPNQRRLQPVASQPINLCRILPIIDREYQTYHIRTFWGIHYLLVHIIWSCVVFLHMLNPIVIQYPYMNQSFLFFHLCHIIFLVLLVHMIYSVINLTKTMLTHNGNLIPLNHAFILLFIFWVIFVIYFLSHFCQNGRNNFDIIVSSSLVWNSQFCSVLSEQE